MSTLCGNWITRQPPSPPRARRWYCGGCEARGPTSHADERPKKAPYAEPYNLLLGLANTRPLHCPPSFEFLRLIVPTSQRPRTRPAVTIGSVKQAQSNRQ